MSKRGGFPGMGGGFGGMNINQLMKEAKKMQADMEKSQEELQIREFESTAGGGAVTVKVAGTKQIKELKISKEKQSKCSEKVFYIIKFLNLYCLNQ